LNKGFGEVLESFKIGEILNFKQDFSFDIKQKIIEKLKGSKIISTDD
jgi:hypothetical protein